MNGGVCALAVSGSDLYAGGHFTVAGGSAATNIAKWNGSSWSALGSGMGGGAFGLYVYALAVSGTNMYAGGDFASVGGVAGRRVAKWNGRGWWAVGSGMSDAVYALGPSGTDLYAGGNFQTAGFAVANSIAKWDGSSWSALSSGMSTLDIGVRTVVNALTVSGSELYAGGVFGTA